MSTLNQKQKNLIAQFERYANLKESKIFTTRQLNKLIELVACSYIYNVDMKTGQPGEQKLLKNIYFILTGNEDPESER